MRNLIQVYCSYNAEILANTLARHSPFADPANFSGLRASKAKLNQSHLVALSRKARKQKTRVGVFQRWSRSVESVKVDQVCKNGTDRGNFRD